MKLILASRSPRRSQLLSMAGIPFSIAPSACDEEAVAAQLRMKESNLPVDRLAEELALSKARSVLAVWPDHLILAADTLVSLEGEIFGKPQDRKQAREMLRRLSGRTHRVDTGVALVTSKGEDVFSTASLVTFRPLIPVTETLIDRYAESGLPLDKAGAYGIQELGGLLIERIEGDFFSVMGLPIAKVHERLQTYGLGL